MMIILADMKMAYPHGVLYLLWGEYLIIAI